MKTCDDCFEDFEETEFYKDQNVCKTCYNEKRKKAPEKYTDIEKMTNIWKILCSRGFKDQIELDEYQIMKKDYTRVTGKELPKLKETINNGKRRD